MAEEDGSESQILRLYMRQLSLNLDVLSSTLSRLSMEGRVWTILTPALQLRVLEEEELFIDPDHKANISEAAMARTPYVTVRGAGPTPPPSLRETTMPTEYERRDLNPQSVAKDEEEKPEKAKPIDFDVEKANELLDVVHETADLPSLLSLNQAAMINLSIMTAEVQEELDKRAEEQRKKDEEAAAKAEKKKQDRLKEVQREELEAKEKAAKAEKEKLYA